MAEEYAAVDQSTTPPDLVSPAPSSDPLTHLQAASTRTVRSRALPDFSRPPSRRVSPLWRTGGANPAILAT
jgi:hypothetical protein